MRGPRWRWPSPCMSKASTLNCPLCSAQAALHAFLAQRPACTLPAPSRACRSRAPDDQRLRAQPPEQPSRHSKDLLAHGQAKSSEIEPAFVKAERLHMLRCVGQRAGRAGFWVQEKHWLACWWCRIWVWDTGLTQDLHGPAVQACAPARLACVCAVHACPPAVQAVVWTTNTCGHVCSTQCGHVCSMRHMAIVLTKAFTWSDPMLTRTAAQFVHFGINIVRHGAVPGNTCSTRKSAHAPGQHPTCACMPC
eukprot:352193-Chlamydomonas_euryale.AAC.23